MSSLSLNPFQSRLSANSLFTTEKLTVKLCFIIFEDKCYVYASINIRFFKEQGVRPTLIYLFMYMNIHINTLKNTLVF